MQVESITIDFEVDIKKFDVLLLPSGCKIAETSLINKLKITISIKGEIIVLIIKRIPTKPTEFFIKIELAKIKSMPSLKYPPIIGM